MTQFLLAPENYPFTITLGLMIAIGLMEVITTLSGLAASGLLDSILPDLDMDGASGLDLDDMGSAGALSRWMGWLHFGRVPTLVLFILFLLGFGCIGLMIQSFSLSIFEKLLPGGIASLPALLGALVFVHWTGKAAARLLPGDETEAVSENSFAGRVAIITLGTARKGHPAQAKVRDAFGNTHYLMVEPDDPHHVFETGDEVLLVMNTGAVFYAMPNPGGPLPHTSDTGE